MAEASEDRIIHDEWWLLVDVLEFVLGVTGLTPFEGETLLLDYAQMGWFDDFLWHEAGPRIVQDLIDSLPGSSPMRPPGAIPPRQWGRRDLRLGTENVVEWPHSRVVHRLTSPAPTVSAQEIHDLLVPFGALPDGHTMHLVRLRGVDAISMLRHAGLLSREGEIALLRAIGFLPDVAQEMIEETETEETEAEETPAAEQREPTGWQAERALRVMREVLYPPSGKAPRTKELKEIGGQVGEALAKEEQGKPKPKPNPSPEVIRAVVAFLGRRDD
jgi:hypothetical protein